MEEGSWYQWSPGLLGLHGAVSHPGHRGLREDIQNCLCSGGTERWRGVNRLLMVVRLLSLHGAFSSAMLPETCTDIARIQDQVP